MIVRQTAHGEGEARDEDMGNHDSGHREDSSSSGVEVGGGERERK